MKALPPPATERVFFLRHASYRDPDGVQHLIQRFTDHDVPPAVARRALKRGAAIPVSDERRKKLHNTWPTRPRASDCESLDDAAWAPSAENGTQRATPQIKHSAFEMQVLDRGPVRTGTIRVGREEATS